MKTVILLLIFAVTFSYGQATKYKAEEIHPEGMRVQSSLKTLFKDFNETFTQEKSLTVLQQRTMLRAIADSYKMLKVVNGETQKKAEFAPSQLASLQQSLKQLKSVAAATPLSYRLGNSLESWFYVAENFSQSIPPFATLAENQVTIATVQSTKINPVNAVRSTTQSSLLVGRTINDQTNFVVESAVPGLETPEDRVKFVEELTRQNAAFSRSLTNAQRINSNVRVNPPVFPSAYVYSNGTPGNLSNLGRRDTLTPLFNNRSTVTPVRREPIRIRFGD